MHHLSAVELAEWLAASDPSPGIATSPDRQEPMLLDVREPWEYALCHIAGSVLMPMRTLPTRLNELDATADIVVICHHGVRSLQVGAFLERQGFSAIYNLAGGVDAWANDVEPAMDKY